MTECKLAFSPRPTLTLPAKTADLALAVRVSKSCGQLTVGCVRAKAERGVILLDLAPLPDGEYVATFELGCESYPVALLRKIGGRVEDVTSAPEEIAALARKTAALETRLARAETTIQKLCEKIGSDTVFSL